MLGIYTSRSTLYIEGSHEILLVVAENLRGQNLIQDFIKGLICNSKTNYLTIFPTICTSTPET